MIRVVTGNLRYSDIGCWYDKINARSDLSWWSKRRRSLEFQKRFRIIPECRYSRRTFCATCPPRKRSNKSYSRIIDPSGHPVVKGKCPRKHSPITHALRAFQETINPSCEIVSRQIVLKIVCHSPRNIKNRNRLNHLKNSVSTTIRC